ncbi:DJ-1/PfpI family protein [Neiella marina]|uniref:DJ-1/PfpI family protein n=1 Tax=Neiella holothuriorum TaxID=2870530 RepID=A0ABS7EKU6_9GAMM|nr:DJ-1/PfpI family protein [Neiella holothuriorum]MBW8192830.1 DJ-1/PfpI family protein [Neiella holothuriorum]
MKIHFLVFDRVEELDLVGSWEFVGLLANKGLCEKPKLITLNTMTPTGEHGMRFSADHHFSDVDVADVVVVPGGSGARTAMLDDDVIRYLQHCETNSQAILSICTGMYLMQKAGLLNGRKATTHWAFLEQLKSDPAIDVVEERFVQDGHIWSSAGVSAGMDMMLAFIADTFGDSVAADIQLEAEYYPSAHIYGEPQNHAKASSYVKKRNGKNSQQ